jgi:hypothetical protein
MEYACLYTSNCSVDWIIDSRSYHHVTPSKDNFVSYISSDYGKVQFRNNHFCSIVGVGDAHIKTKEGHHILLKRDRHVPYMCMHMLCVG